jgi:hypothetical protein
MPHGCNRSVEVARIASTVPTNFLGYMMALMTLSLSWSLVLWVMVTSREAQGSLFRRNTSRIAGPAKAALILGSSVVADRLAVLCAWIRVRFFRLRSQVIERECRWN